MRKKLVIVLLAFCITGCSFTPEDAQRILESGLTQEDLTSINDSIDKINDFQRQANNAIKTIENLSDDLNGSNSMPSTEKSSIGAKDSTEEKTSAEEKDKKKKKKKKKNKEKKNKKEDTNDK